MRVSNKMMSRQFLSNLNKLYNDMAYSHKQVSTGKAFFKVSDDPINAVKSMNIKSELQRADLYESNIKQAVTVLDEQEVAISHISDSLVNVQEVLQQASNETYNENDRKSMAQVVDATLDNIKALLNKDYAGKYIFGGYNTASTPITGDPGALKYNGQIINGLSDPDIEDLLSQSMDYNTGKGTKVDVALSALEITGAGNKNLFSLLEDISEKLNDPLTDTQEFSDSLKEITDYFDDLQVTRSSVGAKISNMNMLEDQIFENKINLEELQSKVSEIDIEKAVIDYQTNQMVYNAALKVGANIIKPTLVDFLR
ncbi:MAG: flagellar hook-associated protein FlgL [Bacillota bacterium]|nr:flagellar hook-associated protein FlgL [Bacillota bacterium]